MKAFLLYLFVHGTSFTVSHFYTVFLLQWCNWAFLFLCVTKIIALPSSACWTSKIFSVDQRQSKILPMFFASFENFKIDVVKRYSLLSPYTWHSFYVSINECKYWTSLKQLFLVQKSLKIASSNVGTSRHSMLQVGPFSKGCTYSMFLKGFCHHLYKN